MDFSWGPLLCSRCVFGTLPMALAASPAVPLKNHASVSLWFFPKVLGCLPKSSWCALHGGLGVVPRTGPATASACSRADWLRQEGVF